MREKRRGEGKTSERLSRWWRMSSKPLSGEMGGKRERERESFGTGKGGGGKEREREIKFVAKK